METAVLFTLAGVHGIRAGSLLIVSDTILPERRRITAEALTAAEHSLGDLATSALSGLPVR
jgi:purine-nucleoside phosphorylase